MTQPAALGAIVGLLCAVSAAAGAAQGVVPRDDASEAEIVQAFAAIEAANGYSSIVEAVLDHEAVVASVRTVELADERLRSGALDTSQQGVVMLMRQLSIDCRGQGARPAARLLAVRLVAAYALAADMPLMQQLARDWPESGALAAAVAMANGASAGGGGTSGGTGSAEPRADQPLVGHWRFTSIQFDSPQDENLVLRADGSAEHWFTYPSGRSEVSTGRWTASGSTFSVSWADGEEWSQPFTFYEGQFVFPNIQGRRKIWERIQ